MNFLKMFLQGIAILPSLIQGVESLYGAKTGAQKKEAALGIVQSAINMTDAVIAKQIIDANWLYGWAGEDCGRRSGLPEREHLA